MRIKRLLCFPLLVCGFSLALAAAPTNKAVEESLTCQCSCGLTVHSCNHLQCGFAVPAKEQIAEQIGQGESQDAILTSFVSRYGEKVLSAPTTSGFNLVAWITPFLVVLIGGVGVGLISLRWTKRRPQDQASAAPPDEPNPYRERLQKELDDFEG